MLYEIHVVQRRHRRVGHPLPVQVQTKIRNPKTFLYNTGPINDIGDATWNRPQYYSVTRVKNGKQERARREPALPAGERRRRAARPTTPRWPARPCTTIGPRKVFAGQRADAFHVDLGSIFDLGALRPFNEAHLISMPEMNGVNAVQSYNVHTIAIQVPIARSPGTAAPDDPMETRSR